MNIKILFLFIFLFLSALTVMNGQAKLINGKIIDQDDKKPVNNVSIFLKPGNQVIISNQRGEFKFSCMPGRKEISTSIIGYKASKMELELKSDTIITIYIQTTPYELGEVKVMGDSIKNLKLTLNGSFILTPASIRETPRLFSEPDLLKSLQLIPGVISGKDGSSEIFVRGGTAGQNVVLADGCYFFLPGHLLGFVSPYDLDFLESAELYKDYLPAEFGGGASSIIRLDFKEPQSDSLKAQLRLGLISSGITFELPFRKINWNLTAGLRRSNYSLYSPLLKKVVSSTVKENLPPDNYSFYDGYIKLSHSSTNWGKISYLFFGNTDNGKKEQKTTSQSADTLINYTSGITTGWNSMVHALRWDPPSGEKFKWRMDLNYSRISLGRDLFMNTDKYLNETDLFESRRISYSFSPTISTIGSTFLFNHDADKFSYSAGVSTRFRYYSPNIIALDILNETESKNVFGESSKVIEPAAFFSSTMYLAEKLKLNAGLRISSGISSDATFYVLEPRLGLVYNQRESISPHIYWNRLSQYDHSVEGSNAGLRSMFWVPVSKDFGPEVSDVFSAGMQGHTENDLIWMADVYYKKVSGMVDFKPGASFIFDNSITDMLDRINGKAYGLETALIKSNGKMTGSASYTYSRSKGEWSAPEGMIWIPSSADRPHNVNVTMKYHINKKMSFGLNWVYTSGSPATIYMHNTSYGEWFETKNNIRYFDYHRLDISYRHIIFKRGFTILLDVDVYNVYNRKNTFYFLQTYDSSSKSYYFKNVSLFPVMPSLTLTIKY
jgi:hypothetical protein